MSAVLCFTGTVLTKKAGSFDGKANYVATVGWMDLEAGEASSVSLYFPSGEELEKFPAKGSNVRIFCKAFENKKLGKYSRGDVLKVETITPEGTAARRPV